MLNCLQSILSLAIAIVSIGTASVPQSQESIGYIYIGDSRFVGMNACCGVDEEDNTWVVAKVGEGLQWCENYALKEIGDIIDDNPYITE